ncbi:hypothetical protein HDU87_004285 [Geranomyces variabilis]|uniref:Uncharacterized protein n=1 Tax=Geranomyces variabilis TaxID=109894 RepID=A0AAD5TJ00_9FUNG|nr:hypothetical protein HDU87_004285 [Geranomyces variabilis]
MSAYCYTGGAAAAASTRASEIEQVANQLLVSRSPLTAAAEKARPEAPAPGRLAQIQSAKVVTGIKYVRPKTVAPAQASGKPTETRAKSIAGQGASGPSTEERIEKAASVIPALRESGLQKAADSRAPTNAAERGRSAFLTSDLGKTTISTALSGDTNAASPSLSSAFGEAMNSITAAYAAGNTGSGALAKNETSQGTRGDKAPRTENENKAVAERAADTTATVGAVADGHSASSANEAVREDAAPTTATTIGEGLTGSLPDERPRNKAVDATALPEAAAEGGSAFSTSEPDDIKAIDHTISGKVGDRRLSTLSQMVMGPRPVPAGFGEPRAPSAIPPLLAISMSSDNLDKSLPPTPIPIPSPVRDDAPAVNIVVSTSSEHSTPAGGSSRASTPDTSVVVTLKRNVAGGFRNPLAHFSAASSDSSVDSVHEPLQFTIHSPSSTIEIMRRTTKVVELEDLPTSRRGSILTSNAGTPGPRRESFLAATPGSEKEGENAQSQRSRRESLRNDSASSSPHGSRRGSFSGIVTNVVPVGRRSSIVKVPAAPPVLPNFRFSNVPLRSKIGIAASPDIAGPPTPNLPQAWPVFDQPKFVGAIKPNPASTTPATGTSDSSPPVSDAARSPAPDQASPINEEGDTPSSALPVHIILAGERLLLNARTAMGSHSYLSESDNHSSMGDLRGHHMDRSVSMNTLASIIDGSDGDVTGLSIPVKVNGGDCKISFRANRLTCVDVRGKMYGRYFALDMSRILVAGNIGATVTMFAIPPKVLTAGVKFRAFAFDCANEVQGAACPMSGNFPDLVDKKAFLMIDESDEKTFLDLIRKYITPVLACVGKELTVQVRRRRSEPQMPDFQTTNFVAKISSKVPVQDADTSRLLKGALSATGESFWNQCLSFFRQLTHVFPAKVDDVNILPSGDPIDPVELALAIVKGKVFQVFSSCEWTVMLTFISQFAAPLKDGVIVVLNAQVHRAGLVGMVKKILKQ